MTSLRGALVIASWPRSGNTLIRSILWSAFGVPSGSIHADEDNTLGVEAKAMVGGLDHLVGYDVGALAKEHGLFGLKLHSPPAALGGVWPTIYVVRDGREACVSYKHFNVDFMGRPDCTCRDIIVGNCRFGSWSGHMAAWEPHLRSNTITLRYEDVCDHVPEAIKAIGTFIGREPKTLELPGWETYKNTNPKFFRSGKRDTWKQELSRSDLATFWRLHGQAMIDYGYTEGGE